VLTTPDVRPDGAPHGAPSPNGAPHTVPAALSGFVGRARDLAGVGALLGRARLVTLAGPGGVGKTRLARETAARAAVSEPTGRAFPDGVWWVELAPLPPGADPAPAAAAALGVRQPPGAGSPVALADAVAAALAGRRLLVVLDNCEHVVEGAAALAAALLRACPGLTLLATSREALGVEGEVVWPVAGLAHPPRADAPLRASADAAEAEAFARAVAGYEAVELFVQRARAVQPRFALTARSAPAVAAIAARLDGQPLALELAAAQVATLGIEQLAVRLGDVFAVLTRGRRTALPRHKTLRALLDWSYHLLGDGERTLLRRVSAFHGAFTLDAAARVCGDGPDDDAEVTAALGRLVEQSLVQVRDEDGEVRYALLETVRQYGAGLLAGTPDAARTRDRHLRWAAALVTAAEPRLVTRERWREIGLLQQHLEDLRAAVHWAAHAPSGGAADRGPGNAAMVDRGLAALAVVGGLTFFWVSAGTWDDAVRIYATARRAGARIGLGLAGTPAAEAAHARTVSAAVRRAAGRALYAGGALGVLTGRLDEALADTERALAWWDTERDLADTAARRREAERWRALNHQTALEAHLGRGDVGSARTTLTAATAAAADSGDERTIALIASRGAVVDAAAGDTERAAAACERVLPWWRANGDGFHLSMTLHLAADLARTRGDLGAAMAYAHEAVAALGGTPDLWFLSRAVEAVAAVRVAASVGAESAADAVRLLGAAAALRARAGVALLRIDEVTHAATRQAAEAWLEPAAMAAAWAEGERLGPAEVVAFVERLASAPLPQTADAIPGGPRHPAAARPARSTPTARPAAATLQVLAFGPPVVTRNGAAVPPSELTPAKVRELLLYLALHPEGRTKEQAALALWPDASPAQVRNAFHVTMHQLRRALGHKEAVAFDRGAYALARAPRDPHAAGAGPPAGGAGPVEVTCDVDAALAAAEATRAADRAAERGAARGSGAVAAAGADAAALARWRRALDLARRGPLGEGEDAGGWLAAHQARVRAAWADGAEALARLHARAGAPGEAAAVLEALVAAEPLREGAHRALMATYVAAGEPARALAHYDALAALLARELGAAPGRETRALAEAIRSGGRPA
jgi:predicted ATPase/DNA-binding SARP family transcriptional activator